MAGINATKEKYGALSKGQKIAYWALVAAAAGFIGFMLLLYKG